MTAAAPAADPLTRFFDQVHSLSGQFEQVVVDDAGKVMQQSSGAVWIQRPDKFRWSYAKPFEQHIVGDGERIWVYDVGLEQVTVRPMTETLGDTPALLLAGRGRVTDRFRVTEMGEKDGLNWYQLQPKSPKEGEFTEIRLGFVGESLSVLEFLDGFGQVTRIRLKNYNENRKIDPARFTFKPPAGVDVIEQ